MADISFNIACKELKIAQIAQLNQLFQLLHLVRIQYIRPQLPWVKSYANEEKCKQWRQQSFAYYWNNEQCYKCLIRQGCHKSGEPITVVPELKRYVRNSKATYDRIVGALGRSYVLRHPRNTFTSWIWIDWSKGSMKVEGHLLACSRYWWFCWKEDLWKKDSIALTLCSLLHSYRKSAVSFDMYSQQFTLYVISLSKAFFLYSLLKFVYVNCAIS